MSDFLVEEVTAVEAPLSSNEGRAMSSAGTRPKFSKWVFVVRRTQPSLDKIFFALANSSFRLPVIALRTFRFVVG